MRSAPTPIDEFIDALGGTGRVAAITGRRPSAVSNWRAAAKIPSELYILLRDVAEEAQVDARPEFFGMAVSEAAQ